MAEQRQQHTKVTRQDWIGAALASLEHEAIDQLRVLTLARSLGVSRSSFYWYFDNPADLQFELLGLWQHNTKAIIERTERSTPTIVTACLGVFECWADDRLYVPALDVSVRDWGRRDATIAGRAAEADEQRLQAITAMFACHGFDDADAVVRARLLYHSQVGYYALGTDEPMQTRMKYLPYYLEAMTGTVATAAELATFESLIQQL